MPGKSPVTLNAIALHAGVSKMTASAIINGSHSNTRVSATTRERVLAAAREMGYRPNPIAQALATGQSRTITLWTPTDFGPYLALLAHHIRREARRHGYTLTIWDMPPGKPEEAVPQTGAFPEWTVEGILVPDGREWVNAYLDLVKAPLSLVSLGGYCSERADYVGVDLQEGTREALRHLHAGGRRRIAYLVPRRGVLSGDPRYDAYQSFMVDAGLPEERVIASDSLRAGAYVALAEHLKERNPPEALFCYNDEMAIGANRALREAGLQVPEDVALVGCDGIEEMEYHEPPLSTVVLPLQEMCALAWQCLQNRIATPDAPRSQISLPTQLIVRRSS